ncbi:MAG: Asp-tRNA(Asn)/Glu-tRNA(Gln) amidotransferase subunit GatC [Candidatus Zixiibacteriota bacterium]
MPISRDDVAHVARLAKLELTEAEMEQFGRELAAITGYVAQLTEAALSGGDAPPVLPLIAEAVALREDIVQPSFNAESAVGQAPAQAGHFFRVPKVIG